MKQIILMMVLASSLNADLYNDASGWFKFECVHGAYKQEMEHHLYSAQARRKKANDYLIEADVYASMWPEIDVKHKMRTLISSCVGATAIQDPQMKLLAVGLALMGDLAADVALGIYDNLFHMRKALANAAAELEESNAHYRLALCTPICTEAWGDNAYKYGMYLENTVHSLILLDMFTLTVNSKALGYAVCAQIFGIREAVLQEFLQHGKIISIHSVYLEYLRENLSEIMAECHHSDKALLPEMDRLLRQARYYLRGCERELGMI